MSIDIVEIWTEITDGQISSIFDRVYCPQTRLFFSFPDDNFSLYQLIFTKLGMCIDFVEVCLGRISSVFSNSQGIFTKFYVCIVIVELWFRIAHWQISSILTELSVRDMIMARSKIHLLFVL